MDDYGSVTNGSVDWSNRLSKFNDTFGSAKGLLAAYKGFSEPQSAYDAIGEVAKIASMFV